MFCITVHGFFLSFVLGLLLLIVLVLLPQGNLLPFAIGHKQQTRKLDEAETTMKGESRSNKGRNAAKRNEQEATATN